VTFSGLTPYLHYDDAAAASAWLVRVFGFEESRRHVDGQGVVQNVEMRVGATELWLDGLPDYWKQRGRRPEQWIGVWVDDVDAMFARVRAAGVEAEPPADKPYGVRQFQVTDPEGYVWGFMRRIG
jgi:uncharacterized glyoxalase superfamily protein PhnB